MFRITVFVVVAALQFLCYTRARRWAAARFPGSARARILVNALFACFALTLFVAVFFGMAGGALPGWLTTLLARPFYIWLGGTIGLGLVLLLWMILEAPFRLGRGVISRIPRLGARYRIISAHPASRQFDAARRAFLFHAAEGITLASFGGATYGVFRGRYGFQYTAATMELDNLPPQLEGFTIGLLSDIHSSSFMTKPDMDGYCRGVMSLGADMIVVPGDFVNSQTSEVYPFAESFSALHATSGVFGVMGNHDFYAGDPERVAREVDGCGIRLLRNDSVIITHNGGSFALAGIDDVGRRDIATRRMQRALHGVPGGMPKVLLSHRPYHIGEAGAEGVDLMLSGHTHGGQIVLGQIAGVTITPASLASPYVWGKYRLGRTQMYVSRGIGTVGLPMRINCPPEITKITLRRAAAPGGGTTDAHGS